MKNNNNIASGKPNYWFTADEHYYHDNIIKYCNRPFKNSDEMTEELIRRHNEAVGTEDTVIHAGDFTLKGKTVADNVIRRLNGKHIFLQGSHDNWGEKLNLPYILEKEINGLYIVVCHYAMLTFPRSHYGAIQLFGHSHGKIKVLDRQMDIGVDTCYGEHKQFYPYSLDEIRLILNV